MEKNVVYNENCMTGMRHLADDSVDCCVTSPPYLGLRDYGIKPIKWAAIEYAPMAGMPEISIVEWLGVLGLETTIEMYIGHIVAVCREIRRVLKDQGTLWLNIGDSYAGPGMGAANIRKNQDPNKRQTRVARWSKAGSRCDMDSR